MTKSYWKDLAARIRNKIKENIRNALAVSGIASLFIGQVILGLLIGGIFGQHELFGYFLGAMIGVALCLLEFSIWIDYDEWKRKQETKVT